VAPLRWLTGTGRTLLISGLLLFVAGWALGYVELSIFGAAAFMAVLIGAVWLVRRSSLEVTRAIEPSRVERGGVALGLVSVANLGRHPTLALSAVDVVGSDRVEVALPRLGAGAHRTTTYRLPTGRRGAIDVGPLTILQEDPLATFRKPQAFGGSETLWVHPVVHPLLSVGAGRSRHLDGPTSDSAPQGSITFHALREYVPGDDLRRIHWRSTARLGELMVMTNVDTSQPETAVLLDTRRSAYDDAAFEEAMEVAASVIVASTRNGFPVRLRTACGIAVPARGTGRDGATFLDQLCLIKPSIEASMTAAAESMSKQRRADALLVVTGSLDADAMSCVAALHRRFDTTTLVCIGRRAEHPGSLPPRVGIIEAATAREFARAWNVGLHQVGIR
jgi:uncharacterized protein (DUF58 family)